MPPRRGQTLQIELDDSIARVIAGWHAARPDLRVEPIAITARLARLQARLGPRLEEVFVRFGLRGTDFAVLATLVRLARARGSRSGGWGLSSVSLRGRSASGSTGSWDGDWSSASPIRTMAAAP